MVILQNASLAQLIARAKQLCLLTDHRFVEQFVYLDVQGHRYVFDKHMGRTFLLGLLYGVECVKAGSDPARAA